MNSDLPSKQELDILLDQSFLKLKSNVSKKIVRLLSRIELSLKAEITKSSFPFPEEAFTKSGKISKGDNYRELPYFVLDFPRLFTQSDAFAFRTMLRWGHEFSCTLHIGGESLALIGDKTINEILSSADLYFCISPTPWEYHFDSTNYVQANTLSKNEVKTHIESNQFIKISRYTNISKWNELEQFTLENFISFLNLIKK